jgi:hypothetical protein
VQGLTPAEMDAYWNAAKQWESQGQAEAKPTPTPSTTPTDTAS